jgi:hypothetical protein
MKISENKMPLNLSRTVATQGVRYFSHQTWVSGNLFGYLVALLACMIIIGNSYSVGPDFFAQL